MPGIFLIPTPERVNDACKEFDAKNNILEGALDELFRHYHQNTDPRHTLLKVVTLNRLYSAGVLAVEVLASHISQIGEEIDSALTTGAPSIIDRIANVTIQEKEFRFFSFATKYCNWHRPHFYPVYDSRVDRYLWSLQKHKKFSEGFNLRSDLCKDAVTFLKIMTDFRISYGLEAFSFKEIDKFLWLRGNPRSILKVL